MHERASSAAEIFARLRLRGDSSAPWLAVLSLSKTYSSGLKEFCDELEMLAAMHVRIVDCENTPITSIVESSHNPDSDILVLTGLEKWLPANWETLDLNRSGLERRGPLLFWLSPKAVTHMFQHAPNVRSYLGSSLFLLDFDSSAMSETERSARLKDLAERFGMSDEEVIRRAEEKNLPSNPSFAEWLILLDRGDLL